ncbi:MAG: putative DNA binding domain-containing protein [Prevotella sp.]|nr:putative DNA binding domain-containing protein [Prevotella sp.]
MKPRESQNVEYKSSWHDKYLEWICGFANAQGAVMYFGVNDDHEVIGLENVDRLMEDIPNKIVTTMGIVVDVNLYEVEGLDYIEVVVGPSNIPINYRGKYYYRSGSTMQELRGPALQQFVLKKMGRSWDDITNEFATIDDLDRSAIDYFLRKGIKAGRISEDEANSSTQSVLENLHLLSEDGKLKNAALLLFAKNPQCYFTCVEFKIGRFRKDEADLITQDVIEGNIIQMTDRVMDILKTKYFTSPIHYEGMQRIEKLEVPEDGLREIFYNAIAHKDYMGAPIQMRVWDDYCEIWNEGGLPSGFTPETLLKKHSSHPRNKNIAYAFFKAGFIESWGRGYKKIREGFEGAGLPMPKIEDIEGGVRVTFQRNNVGKLHDETTPLSEGLPKGLSERLPKGLSERLPKGLSKTTISVCVMTYSNRYVSRKEMADSIGISTTSVQKHINKLKALGVLKRVDSARNGHWEFVDEETE